MIKIFTSTIADSNMLYKFGEKLEVDANHQRFFASHGINPNKVVYMQQVHGDRIGVVKRPQIRKRTDGLITATPNLWLAIYHADCIPLFVIYNSKFGFVVGVAHVGWKGAVAQLPAKMVGEMVKHFKVDPKDITVKFGPFICKDHYDVNLDDERLKLLPHQIKGDKAYVDLYQAVVDQLPGVRVESVGECTAESPNYWSYHKEREKLGGVMISVIGISLE